MFAFLALVCFVLATFGVAFDQFNVLALGLAFLALHALLGWGPVAERVPWRRP